MTLTDGSPAERPFDLAAGLGALEDALSKIRDAKLVIIDPISAYLGNTDSNVNAKVRGLLAPLAALAANDGVAVLAVTHLRKSSGAAVHRAIASIAFAAAARAVWAVAPDPEDPERRLMVPVKQNLAANIGGLAFRVEAPKGLARVAWEPGPVTVDANDVLGDMEGREDRSARQEAESWLGELLTDGRLSVKKIQAEARAAGLAWRTVERAKRSLGILAVKGNFQTGWEWRLREDSHEDRQPHISNLAAFDEVIEKPADNDSSVLQDRQISPIDGLRDVAAFDAVEKTPWVGPPPRRVSCATCGQVQESTVALAHHLEKEHASGVPQ